MTHAELVGRAGKWLKGVGCPLVFTELVTTQSEQPDAIGWRNRGSESYLIECKTSRSDFLADRRKPHRMVKGLGRFRYFMCPPGMITPDELPPRWGLLYCHATRVDLVAGRHPQRYAEDDIGAFWNTDSNQVGEMVMLYSALIRLRLDLGDKAFHTSIHLPFNDRKKARRAKAAEEGA